MLFTRFSRYAERFYAFSLLRAFRHIFIVKHGFCCRLRRHALSFIHAAMFSASATLYLSPRHFSF